VGTCSTSLGKLKSGWIHLHELSFFTTYWLSFLNAPFLFSSLRHFLSPFLSSPSASSFLLLFVLTETEKEKESRQRERERERERVRAREGDIERQREREREPKPTASPCFLLSSLSRSFFPFLLLFFELRERKRQSERISARKMKNQAEREISAMGSRATSNPVFSELRNHSSR
jgi:hypothetical protein